MPLTMDASLLPEVLTAFIGLTALFYALRGLSGLPVLARMFLGCCLILAVFGGFGGVIFGLAKSNGGAVELAKPFDRTPSPSTVSPPADAPVKPFAATPSEKSASPTASKGGDGCEPQVVFFGTDRARETDTGEARYGVERANRLELGRAVVDIPCGSRTVAPQASASSSPVGVKVEVLEREPFLAVLSQRIGSSPTERDQALILVHGYNTIFDQAVARAAQVARELRFRGATFVYSWPSAGKMASYTYDRESVRQSVPHLQAFLELVLRETGARKVIVVAHSLASEPLLEVLKVLQPEARDSQAVRHVVLAAPDADREGFAKLVREVAPLVGAITIYASATERAVVVSRRFHGGAVRAGDVGPTGPLILPGVATIDFSDARGDGFGLSQPDPVGKSALLDDIGALIGAGELQPEQRIPALHREKAAAGGSYWRLAVPQ